MHVLDKDNNQDYYTYIILMIIIIILNNPDNNQENIVLSILNTYNIIYLCLCQPGMNQEKRATDVHTE